MSEPAEIREPSALATKAAQDLDRRFTRLATMGLPSAGHNVDLKFVAMSIDASTACGELLAAAEHSLEALRVIARLGHLPTGGECVGNWAHVEQLTGELAAAVAKAKGKAAT